MAEQSSHNRNILLSLCYDGTAYHGWQVQANAGTVQQTLQNIMEKVLGYRPPVIGCSRTDAGVHANEYFCNFHTDVRIPCENLRRALNANLPDDIVVNLCREVPDDFHARYSACGKEYLYKIWNSDTRNPFLNGHALFYPYRLNLDNMRAAAAGFLGRHDFSAFCSAGSTVADTVRCITLLELAREGNLVTLRIQADGFLYNMVRIITGTLLGVSQGLFQAEDIPQMIRSGSRARAGKTAPPHGLYLNHVFYESIAAEGN